MTPLRPAQQGLIFFGIGTLLFFTVLIGIGYWWKPNPEENRKHRPDFLLEETGEDLDASTLNRRIREAREAARRREIRLALTADGVYLEARPIQMENLVEDVHARLKQIIEELLQDTISDYFYSPIPDGVRLISAHIWRHTAVVNFSRELVERPQGGLRAETLCLYSIVNTILDNTEDLREVRILIEGQPAHTLWGETDISVPLSANISLLRYQSSR